VARTGQGVTTALNPAKSRTMTKESDSGSGRPCLAETDCMAGVVRLELGNAASGLCWRILVEPGASCREISST
jgi:hypothetical protein